MNRLSHTSRRWAATLLLVFFVASYLVMPVQRAHAQLLVYDVGLNPKEYALDSIALLAAKAVIKVFRDIVLNFIRTGRLSGPTFSMNFNIDMARIAKVATRQFLTDLTGINFCAGLPPIPQQAFLRLDLNAALTCSPNGGQLAAFRKGDIPFTPELLALAQEDNNDYWDLNIAAIDQKMQRENIARQGYSNEYNAGQGFLPLKDSKGRVKTPGRIIGDYIQEDVNSMFREGDIADELLEAIVTIADAAFRELINQGLANWGP